MTTPENDDLVQDETFQKLLRETGKIEWKTLAPHLESGGLVLVDGSLDLVKVAYSFAKDEKGSVARWLGEGLVARVGKEQVSEWGKANPTFWAVVVAPWVLIQAADLREA